MSGANLRSLQVLVEFRESLPTLSGVAAEEIQGMILSARGAVQDAEQMLQECRDALWEAKETLRNREEDLGRDEHAAVEDARTEVARAKNHFQEIRAACVSFESAADALANRLISHFTNAQGYLDQRIQAANSYLTLSAADAAGVTAGIEIEPIRSGVVDAAKGASSGRDNAVASPLRGSSVSALPVLPNGMIWVPIGKIGWGGIDGVPGDMDFKKASRKDIREMLETFETELLPIMSRYAGVSVDELSTLDRGNACGGGSKSLHFCHECMLGSGRHSDVIVFHSKPSSTGEEHPASGTRAFQEGRKARVFGRSDNTNPYRHMFGREGAADIWDQGWRWEGDQKELGFTSGRHRALVARELGWKFIPARVLGAGEDEK